MRQGNRLHALVEDTLEVARLGRHEVLLDLEPVDLSDVVREVQARLVSAGDVARAGCSLEAVLGDAVIGRWDRRRLEQIVTKLLANALRFGSGKPISVVTRAEGPTAEILVRDRGIGIAPEDQERVFGVFERAVSARNYGGLGLGLYVARQVVEALGGSVAIESHPGPGTTFAVRLPIAGPQPLRQPRAAVRAS